MSHLRFRPLLLAAVLDHAALEPPLHQHLRYLSQRTATLRCRRKPSVPSPASAYAESPEAGDAPSSYAVPDSSGKWNFANATGTLNLRGVLHIVLGKRSAAMQSVTFTRPAKGNGQVTVKLAGHKVKLFTVTGKVKVKHSGATETLTGITAKLTKPGATKLDKALHKNALKTGQAIGSFMVKVSNTPIAGPGSSPTGTGASGVTPTSSSGVGIALTPDFRSLLDSVGLSTLPLVPASDGLPAPLGTTTIPGADGSSVSLPLNGSTAGGSFDQGTLTGTIPLSGGLRLDNGQVSASLTNPELMLSTGTEGSSLSFSLNGGPELKLFDIDPSQLEQAATPDRERPGESPPPGPFACYPRSIPNSRSVASSATPPK